MLNDLGKMPSLEIVHLFISEKAPSEFPNPRFQMPLTHVFDGRTHPFHLSFVSFCGTRRAFPDSEYTSSPYMFKRRSTLPPARESPGIFCIAKTPEVWGGHRWGPEGEI